SPCRRALRLDRSLPAALRGPRLLRPLRRLASIFAGELGRRRRRDERRLRAGDAPCARRRPRMVCALLWLTVAQAFRLNPAKAIRRQPLHHPPAHVASETAASAIVAVENRDHLAVPYLFDIVALGVFEDFDDSPGEIFGSPLQRRLVTNLGVASEPVTNRRFVG